MSDGMTRMGLEVASAFRYIDQQDDFGPMTKSVLKTIIGKVAEAAICDVEDFAFGGADLQGLDPGEDR